jgi:hypothetical protein
VTSINEKRDERKPVLTTLTDHAPRPGGCKCGWRGTDLMAHVEAKLRRDVEAAGLEWRDGEEPE